MAKRINISIPDKELHYLAKFDKICLENGESRSEKILQLIAEEVIYGERELPKDKIWQDEHCAQEPALPEFLL